ncbi:MAG: right-handed parallel beta-helix repeat-containing protein [Nannocystaceae bacterium]|nr:right-handed parallel beta-helix repeat-containing protein [Nannocystaceae bacterium]
MIDQTTFLNNSTNDTAGGSGGAIYLLDDENYPREGDANAALISGSYFEGNETLGGGGGLWFLTESGRLVLQNNTFFDNRTTASMGMGGAVALVGGPTEVTHCTFANNHAQFHGGGIQAAQDAQVTVSNSLFADNTSDRDGGWAWFHANRELDDGGGNIQWLEAALEIDSNSNKLVTAGADVSDPQLMSPQDNGGATHTMALTTGSPAVDAGVDGGPQADQRGEARNGAPDVGAYELQ